MSRVSRIARGARRAAAALALAAAAGGCGTPPPGPPPPVDAQTAQFASLGRASYERGSLREAARFYEQALARARASDDSREAGRCAYNLAACLLATGDAARARTLLVAARTDFARAGLSMAPILLLDAGAARAQGKPDEAAQRLDEALAGSPDAAVAAEAHALRAELAADAGRGGEATRWAAAATSLVAGVSDPAVRAAVARAAGRAADLEGRPAEAAAAYDAAAEAARRTGRYALLAEDLARAGRAWAKAGDTAKCVDRLCRAARSLHGQGDPVGALKILQNIPAQAVTPEARTLLAEIQAAVAAAPPP